MCFCFVFVFRGPTLLFTVLPHRVLRSKDNFNILTILVQPFVKKKDNAVPNSVDFARPEITVNTWFEITLITGFGSRKKLVIN